jgi:hypothetical protein
VASASVHLAVLVIAKDAARGDLAAGDVVATRAAAAGHRVISRQSVDDSEAAIRSHLARWIDDRQVDVVVVLSGGSPIVKKTLATLVTEPVPGFSDAVRCGSTYVFIVPGAAGPGMDKQVLPYLDPAKPGSLIPQIPRLHAKPAEGVPVPIAPEKTEGGSGVPARMPASVSTRAKQKTGANVIARNNPANDPATKPIDVARLERQLAKSTTPSHDDVTRPEIALILPRLPPGATADATDDDDDDDDDDVGDHTTTDTLAVQPAPPLPPAGSPRTRPPSGSAPTVVPRAGKPAEPKPFSFSTPLRGGPPSQPRERTSSGTPAYQARDPKPAMRPAQPSAATPPVPYVAAKPAATVPREPTAAGTPAYSANDAKPRSSAPSTPPPIQPWRAKSTSSGTPAYPAVTPPPPAPAEPPVEDIEELDPDGTDTEDVDDAENEEKWAATIAAAKAEADAAAAKAEADAAAARADAAKAEADAAAAKAKAAKAEADAAAAKAKADAVVEVPALVEAKAEVPEVKVEAPPPARVRQPTPPPPPAIRPARTPTAPPPLRVSDNDLPRGAFTYPEVPRRSNVVLKVVAALGVTVLGFFAVVYFLDKKDTPKDQVVTAPPTTPIDAPVAVAVAVAVAPDAAEPAIDIDTTPTPTPTQTTTPRPRPGTSTPASRPVTRPTTGPDQGATAAPPEPPPAPEPPVAEADLCDEANCVLSDYDRPCCAKYKAKGPVISQRIGGVPQTLDRSMVRAGVDGIKPRVIKCGEKAGVTGTVKISVSVSPEGAVTGADVQDTPDAALGTCVAGALRAAKFGKSVEGGSFTYPFVF